MSYTDSQISAMTVAQLNALAASTISAFTSSNVRALSIAQLNGLSKTNFQALNAAYLTTTQVAGLSTSQVAVLTTTQLNAMPTADLAALSKTQEQALTVAQIAGLSTTAFNALNLSNLTASQLGGLTATEIGSLSVASFDKLASQISSINAAAFAGVTLADVQSLTAAQINAVTTAQNAALTGAAAAYVKDYQGVYAELAAVKGSGTLTFSGALTLLQYAASGGATAGEFAALTSIAKSLNTSGGPTASALVTQLFDDVVLGNKANATWTGGGSSVTLGNLSATSSETQFKELIGKWFLGTDNPSTGGLYGSTYQMQTGSLFSGTPTYTQVNQGAVGDCYFESAMAAVADFNPTLIQNMITSDGNGVYTVDFYNGATQAHDYVTVNAQMPVMSSAYHFASGSSLTFDSGGASGAIWSEILEKAYVEFRTQSGGSNAYSSISGGWDEGLVALTGQTIQDYSAYGATTAQLSALLTTCSKAMSAGNAVMMNDTSANSSLHLVGNHMYNVLSVNTSAGTVTLDNPWNANGFSGGAGETFTDSISALASAGCTFHVATGTARAFA